MLVLLGPLWCAPASAADESDLSATPACKSGLAGMEALTPALLQNCSDERTATMVNQLLEGQRKLQAQAAQSLPPQLQDAIIKRQIPELIQAVQGLRTQGTQEGSTLSERQAAVALFQGDASSAVDVLESMLVVKKQVPLTLRREGVLLRTHDAPRAARVLVLALAENPNDFALLQQAADSHLVLGEPAKAQALQEKMLTLAQAEAAKQPQDNTAQEHLASSQRDLGDSLRLQDKAAQAVPHEMAAQAIWEKLQQREPQNAQWRNELARLKLKQSGAAPAKKQ